MALSGNLILTLCFFSVWMFAGREKSGTTLLLGVILYAVGEVLFLVWYLHFLRQPINHLLNTVKKATEDEYKAQNLRSQAEVFALQSQINPHFLYNTLDTIRSYALSCNAEDIAAMTESLSTLFRYSISRPGELTTLEEELNNVRNYLLIQQYRFPDKVEYKEEIQVHHILNYKMPVLTIQPIVENAIHHGLEMKLEKGWIKVRVFSTDHNVTIYISDNGIGMREDALARLRQKLKQGGEISYREKNKEKRETGIALLNVDKRLKFYYGNQYGLQVRSTFGVGTMVEIRLPVSQKFLCGEEIK